MRRTTRLLEIIQHLRAAKAPVTAATLAELLEVTVRTIYRDIASLQATRVPIQGEAGIGYVMRQGYDLPPLMLTVEEVEAVVVGLSLLARTGDHGLKEAASVVQAKLASILPDHARRPIDRPSLYASDWGVAEPATLDLAMVRQAIRDERKLAIAYVDEAGRQTSRTICPIAMIYYVEVINLVAWCELRQAIRHFRADRIMQAVMTDHSFQAEGTRLRAVWTSAMATHRDQAASSG